MTSLLIVSGAVLVSALEALLLMDTAALEEVALPLVVSEAPVLALGGGQTGLA